MSKRMERNELLLELDGDTLVLRAVWSAITSAPFPLVVVNGFERERVRREPRGLDHTIVVNPEFEGPSSRLPHVGLRPLHDDVGAAVAMLPDVVRVSAATFSGGKAAVTGASSPLAGSRYGDGRAPPIHFRRLLFDELLAWDDGGCSRPVVRGHAGEALHVDRPAEVLDDLDAPEDWVRLAGRSGAD